MGWEYPADNEAMKKIAPSANLEKNGRYLYEKQVIMLANFRFINNPAPWLLLPPVNRYTEVKPFKRFMVVKVNGSGFLLLSMFTIYLAIKFIIRKVF